MAGILTGEGFFVMEQADEEVQAVHPAWAITTVKTYGGTRLTVYGLV
jgi:16S rRNA G966 N2-methylase RsmD